MFTAISQRTTQRTSLRRISGIDVLNGNPHGLRFVLDKGLKLPESPTVESSSNSLSAFDVLSDVGQIFENNFTHSKTFGFFDNRFAHFVVRVFYSPLLFTRDLSERLFCALAAVGLQATAKRKMFVTSVTKITATKKLTCTRSGKIVFSDINTQNSFGFNGFDVGEFENQIEKPISISEDKFGFLGSSIFKEIRLVFSSRPFNLDSARKSIEGKKVPLERISPLVEVDTGLTKVDFWNTIFLYFPQSLLGLIGFADAKDSIAAHLRTKRSIFPQIGVGTVVKCNPVPTSGFNHNGNQEIASARISRLQFRQGFRLFEIGSQFKGNGLQHLSSLRYVLGTLNVLFDCLGAHMPCCANVIRRRPQMSSPQPFFKHRESHKQPSACSSLKHLDGIRDSNRRGNTQKQMDVVRLNFTSQDFPLSFGANLVKKFFECFSHFTSQNVVPIFRTPHNVVSRLVHTISVCGYVFHTSHSTPCDAASQATIPPPIKIGGFLAEVL